MGTFEKKDSHKKRTPMSAEDKLERDLKDCMHCKFFWGEEKEELLKIYEVTEDEVETIFLDFYNYFGNKIKLTEKEQRRKEEISDIAKKWYYLSGDERKDILDINNVTNYEQSVIEELSQNITKYKNIINTKFIK